MFSENIALLGNPWDSGGVIHEDILSEYLAAYMKNYFLEKPNPELAIEIEELAAILAQIHNRSFNSIARFVNHLINPEITRQKEKLILNIFVLHALSIATSALEKQINKHTWSEIKQELFNSFSALKNKPDLSGCILLIYDAISRVNHNAGLQWKNVYHLTLNAINLCEK